jgi:cephalosporin hydroxylase
MRVTIDTEQRTVVIDAPKGPEQLSLYSRAAFDLLSKLWVKVGWEQKYSYTFSWLGRPVVQLPEDLLRIQEVIFSVQPDVIIETGIAHGGSLIFYATLCKGLEKGRVVGVDIEIRPQNRKAIEDHSLSKYITLIEGSSTAPDVLAGVRSQLRLGEKVLVILDSCHTRAHVLQELEAYGPLVSVGSYIVATDGIMEDLHDVPRGRPEWVWDNPASAARQFAQGHPEFVAKQPPRLFCESSLSRDVTYWPDAFLLKIR